MNKEKKKKGSDGEVMVSEVMSCFNSLILHDNEVLSVATELVNLDLKMGQNISCHLFASVCLCGSASKLALETWC